MKKATKLVNAFKAFEIEKTNEIKGGDGTVIWVGSDGNQTICDIRFSNGHEVCSVPDPGADFEQTY